MPLSVFAVCGKSRHLGAHHKWRADDTKWFHLEIYRQRLLFSSFFCHSGISHVNLLSGEVAFEMQKGLGVAPSLPQIPPHFPLRFKFTMCCLLLGKTLKVFNSTTSPFPLSVSSTIPDCLCRGSTLMSTKLPRRQSRSKRQKKALKCLINQACKQLISFSLHASMKMRFREQYIVQICSFLSEQSQRQLISWITGTVSAVAPSR